MNEKDIICQYAKELKLATIRENISLFVEDATREQWGYIDSISYTSSWWHTIFKSFYKVHIYIICFFIT